MHLPAYLVRLFETNEFVSCQVVRLSVSGCGTGYGTVKYEGQRLVF